MSRGSCLSRFSEPESHPSSSWPHYHRICHQLNIYGMNSIDVFATVRIQRKHYRSCVTHLRKSGTIFHKPLSTDWLVLCIGDAKLSLLQEVVTHVTELHKPPYCMTISVCPWFVLIMMLRNFVDIALFVMPIWIYIIRFFFSMQKILSIIKYIVSFFLLTSIVKGKDINLLTYKLLGKR